MSSPRPNRIDGTRLAVLNARFEGIARKMANTLHRTGRSGILTIARDFSCVILTANHELLALEVMAFTLCAFPSAPRDFRIVLARIMADEQRHTRMHIERAAIHTRTIR